MAGNPHAFDVIIIGAGSIGVPAAFYIAQAGKRTLVLDPAASPGQGSNKTAIGGIRATHSDPAKVRLCLRSLEIFSSWQKQYRDDIEWVKGGYSFVAYGRREETILKDLLSKQKSLGLNIDWYDRDDVIRIIPSLNPDGLLGGTFSPDDGSASPLLSLHAFYRQALGAGVQFCFSEPVTEIISRNGQVTGVKTPRARYEAETVINAAGPWAAQIAGMVGIKLPVKPDSHEAAITEPVAPFLAPMIVDIRPGNGSANCYFYQHRTGQIIFCMTPDPSIWGFDTRETGAFLPQVAKRMITLIPRLKNIRVRRTWRGLYPMTPDGFPIVGWSRSIIGFLLAVGMCGQGYMLGPGLGELLARIVTGHLTLDDQEVLEILSPERKFDSMEELK